MRGVDPAYFRAVLGQFRGSIPIFLVVEGTAEPSGWALNLLWTHLCSLPRTKRAYVSILTYPRLLRVDSDPLSEYKS